MADRQSPGNQTPTRGASTDVVATRSNHTGAATTAGEARTHIHNRTPAFFHTGSMPEYHENDLGYILALYVTGLTNLSENEALAPPIGRGIGGRAVEAAPAHRPSGGTGRGRGQRRRRAGAAQNLQVNVTNVVEVSPHRGQTHHHCTITLSARPTNDIELFD